MKTIDSPPDTQEQSDRHEIMRLVSQGKRVTDPELRKRVGERAETVRQAILERFGTVEWAVDMVRDARDE